MDGVNWILVADRTRAEVLHALSENLGPFPVIKSFIHAEGRLQPHERDSDSPGRMSIPGGAHTAIEPHHDRWRVEAERFAHQIVGFLNQARHDRRFDHLFVIAPPPFLGVLRASMPDVLQRCVLCEEGINLLQMTEDERQKRLANIAVETRRDATTAS